jgi:hypothetical protein
VSGYNIYRCNVGANDSESGSYVKLNIDPLTFCYFNDNSSLNSLTKYYYKVTSVSQTGMESDSVRILAWTSYPTVGLYPVTMDLDGVSIESNFVAEDVNNDGKKDIFSSVRRGDLLGYGVLTALNWEGEELFDIDNNITTYSGFADLSTAIAAGVAIADINNDGKKEIVSLTRGFENNYADNLITCHTAFDSNNDNKPDVLWQISTSRTFRGGAILANMDNSSNGSMEIVTMPCGNSNGRVPNTIDIYNNQGNLIWQLPLGNGQFAYSSAAVADLDGDGDMEIIAGLNNGVYVWHHNGSPFKTTNPFFYRTGYIFGSSPIICDINNDGNKDILLSAYSTIDPSSCRIFAIDKNGQLLSGWSTAGYNYYTATANNSYAADLTKEIVVGDLNGDGDLEVIAVGQNCVKIWNKNGSLYNTITLAGLESQFRYPLLADIDGDTEFEILITSYSENKIYGLKRNGKHVLGFPLETGSSFNDATPVIADLDNNGKSEIIAGTGADQKIYVWETKGKPTRIEWGSARNNSRNTGEYFNCSRSYLQDQTINSNRNVNGCGNVYIRNVSVINNAKLQVEAPGIVSIEGPFSVVIGAQLNVKH